jgi:hypothetical protein
MANRSVRQSASGDGHHVGLRNDCSPSTTNRVQQRIPAIPGETGLSCAFPLISRSRRFPRHTSGPEVGAYRRRKANRPCGPRGRQAAPWQARKFLPLPHRQGSLRPTSSIRVLSFGNAASAPATWGAAPLLSRRSGSFPDTLPIVVGGIPADVLSSGAAAVAAGPCPPRKSAPFISEYWSSRAKPRYPIRFPLCPRRLRTRRKARSRFRNPESGNTTTQRPTQPPPWGGITIVPGHKWNPRRWRSHLPAHGSAPSTMVCSESERLST